MLASIKAGLIAAKAFAIANAPLGLFVGGLVVGVAAIVSVAKAATSAQADMEQHVDNLEQIADEMKDETLSEEDKEDVRADKKKEVKATVATFFRHYWKALILITISGGLLIGGFLWQSKRFAVAAATATAQAALIKTMETNIQKTYGDKAVIAMQDPNWDPSILKKAEAVNEGAAAIKGYDDPYRDYKIENSDPSRSLYLINKFTMDPTKFRVSCVSPYSTDLSIQDTVNTLLEYQSLFNKKLKGKTVMSEIELLDDMGYLCSSVKNNPDLDVLMNKGWINGEFIDFGLGDILAEIGRECDNPDYLSRLAEKYKDGVPIKLNSQFMTSKYLAGNIAANAVYAKNNRDRYKNRGAIA